MKENPIFICILANTETSLIKGVSAAGMNSELTFYTPTGDCELIHTGKIITVPLIPMTPPYDTPTPALISKAILNIINIPYLFIDTGILHSPDKEIPTIKINNRCGQSILKEKSVLDVNLLIEKGIEIGKSIVKSKNLLIIGESTPGGTTTAQAVLNLLGYDAKSSSSFEINPIQLKKDIINNKFKKYDLYNGCFSEDPLKAIESCGDPMMATAIGIIQGAINNSSDCNIILAGGTQMVSVYALLKHLNINTKNIVIATTKYVYEDSSCNLKELQNKLKFTLKVSDPKFEDSNLTGIKRYINGTIKEGAGVGGLLYYSSKLNIENNLIIKELEKICNKMNLGK